MSKLIASICRGFGRRFGNPCEHHWRASAESECKLLQSGRYEEIATQRCTFAMIAIAQRRVSKKFPSLDEREDINLSQIITRAITTAPQRLSIIQWFNRFHRYVHDATIDLLRMRGEIGRNNCGACTSLTITKPYRCTLTNEERNKTDQACDDHLPTRIKIESLDDEEKGEAVIDSESQKKYEDMEVQGSEKSFIEMAGWVLKDRIEEARTSQDRAIKVRQYNLFLRLQCLLEYVKKREALEIIAKESGKSIETIKRDLADIREVLKESRRL